MLRRPVDIADESRRRRWIAENARFRAASGRRYGVAISPQVVSERPKANVAQIGGKVHVTSRGRSEPKSYWALAHPPGKEDFYHFDCFAHELPAA